jgi:hypothetical protein
MNGRAEWIYCGDFGCTGRLGSRLAALCHLCLAALVVAHVVGEGYRGGDAEDDEGNGNGQRA